MAMRIVTINIPDVYVKDFEVLIKSGLFNSRSQIVREALKQFVDREDMFVQDLDPERFMELKKTQIRSF